MKPNFSKALQFLLVATLAGAAGNIALAETSLHRAVKIGDQYRVSALIEQGADVNGTT